MTRGPALASFDVAASIVAEVATWVSAPCASVRNYSGFVIPLSDPQERNINQWAYNIQSGVCLWYITSKLYSKAYDGALGTQEAMFVIFAIFDICPKLPLWGGISLPPNPPSSPCPLTSLVVSHVYFYSAWYVLL